MNPVLFVGAGPGDPELITLKGARLLHEADVVIYAGSLVNPAILKHCKENAELHDSAPLDLPQIVSIMQQGVSAGKKVVRLHTGEPSLFGAIMEQMVELDKLAIPYEIVPGVTSLFAAAAALKVELTSPEVSQTVIISRTAGRTPMPQRETLTAFASIGATLALYLSAANLHDAAQELSRDGYSPATPAAVVYRASWEDQMLITGTLADIAEKAKAAGITKHALVLVGEALARTPQAYSKLYDTAFTHEYRS